jgi:uroporphyrin-III C-methyltransferase
MRLTGKIFLVGAGPGDPELLTVKALRVLQGAETVVFDRLVSNEVLELAPPHAVRIDVGKQAQNHPVPQEEIHAILIRVAKSGRSAVRLKGGDPFIFGRGGEEAIALAEAGIPFEVIPGVTAAQACAASAGVPLTHRGVASGVRYLTGHCRENGGLDYDWRGLADPRTTLVVYMGLSNIPEIAAQLLLHGRDPETPVMAVSRGTTPYERRLMSTLGDAARAVSEEKFAPPTLFIIGEAAAFSLILGQSSDALAQKIAAAG